MGWSIGFDDNWQRDIGYGVPATCDHPGCDKEIHRGLDYVCGGEPHGGDEGCGLFFCEQHLFVGVDGKTNQVCERCADGDEPFDAKPDAVEWERWKLSHKSWRQWREKNPSIVEAMKRRVAGWRASRRKSA